MSEGGILNWKRQQIRSKPSIESKSILLPLPEPPKGLCSSHRQNKMSTSESHDV